MPAHKHTENAIKHQNAILDSRNTFMLTMGTCIVLTFTVIFTYLFIYIGCKEFRGKVENKMVNNISHDGVTQLADSYGMDLANRTESTLVVNNRNTASEIDVDSGTVHNNSDHVEASIEEGHIMRNLSIAMPLVPGSAMLREPENMSSEQRLMSNLLWRYENSVRPIYNSSMAVQVGLGLTLTQILDLDEKNQVLTTNVWMEVEWRDEKLIWRTEEYERTESIRIPCKKLWLPDIVLYNSVDDYTSGYMPSLAMVYSDGRVFWGPVVRFRSSCKIDITYFPFDDQICHLKLGSWAYNGYQVNVNRRSNSIDLSNYVDNGEWELIGVKVKRSSVVYNCCKEPFPDVMFYMHLRRRVKYYFMNIIIPCIILSFLCLAGFLLPPESGEKITLGLSVLLTITVFMLMVADKMPQTSESISLISIYLMVVLSMSCLSILVSVCILSIHHQRGKPMRCPNLIKFFAFSICAKLLCLKLRSSTQTIRRNIVRENPRRPKRSYPGKPEIIQLHERNDFNERLSEYDPFLDTDAEINDLDIELTTLRDKQKSVNNLIHLLHRKHKHETLDDVTFQEWRDVAYVADRMLFVVFLSLTIISTAAILSMRPQQVLRGFKEIRVNRN